MISRSTIAGAGQSEVLFQNKSWEIRKCQNGNIAIEDMKSGYLEITNFKDGLHQPYTMPAYIQKAFFNLREAHLSFFGGRT